MKYSRFIIIFALVAVVLAIPSNAQKQLLQASGKVTMIRVHEVGTGYGAAPDLIDAEVIIKLNSEPNKSFGFQLRNDKNLAAHQGMLDLLRDAFNNNWTTTIDYDISPRRNNGLIIRVWLTK